MIPDFFPSNDPTAHIAVWKPIVGLIIVFLGTCVGVEIRISKEDDDP